VATGKTCWYGYNLKDWLSQTQNSFK